MLTESALAPPCPDAGSARFAAEPRLDVTRLGPGEIRVATTCGEDLELLVAESFHPFWVARVDGRPAPVGPGQLALMTVHVPAGEHVVELRYERPARYAFWGLVGAASFVVCLIGALFPRRRGAGG